MELISLSALCTELSISIATGRNWVKLGKIVPAYVEKNRCYFESTYVKKLKQDIESGANTALKSRRNKTYVSGNSLYHSYVSETSENIEMIQCLLENIKRKNILLDNSKIQILLADCAVQLLADREQKRAGLSEFLDGEISFGDKDILISDLLKDTQVTRKWMGMAEELFAVSYRYEKGEDILGLLYMSCKNIGNRKATGSYYTPVKVAGQLVEKVIEKNGKEKIFLDPCCGTGNFLLQLSEYVPMEQIYGNDLDLISVKLARINMALQFPETKVEQICRHITNQNYLLDFQNPEVDVIIGNPPWGYRFSEEETDCLRERYTTAKAKRVESYDVFVEKSISILKHGGILSFVLPEAILNAKLHKSIREVLLKGTSLQFLLYLGEIFDKVQCPSVILQVQRDDSSNFCLGAEIKEANRTFVIEKEREISSEYFDLAMTDEEYRVMQKITSLTNAVYLKKQAEFALGIVTGNNKKYISETKTQSNEVVLKGSDIYKYRIADSRQYITFRPQEFQQTAPEAIYRAPEKLFYRFINEQLVFAYDDKQRVSLNSCNILIPKIQGLDMKYIMAVLNSRIAQFVFYKKFHSVKVLRTHLEQIPIPLISEEEQERIINVVEKLANEVSVKNKISLYEDLEQEICEAYGLSAAEYEILLHAVSAKILL